MAALQSLFAVDVKGEAAESSLAWLAEEDSLEEPIVNFAASLIRGVTDSKPDLDRVIQRYATAWPVPLLSMVDRNILRIALFELLHTPNVPPKTAVDEAVELAKLFGSDNSARFVNGVLGSVMTELDVAEMVPANTRPEGR
jgi:N utilization substance protein B